MATLDDVRRIASALPGAIKGDGAQCSFGVEVKGKVKGFAWSWMERVDSRKARVVNLDVLAISTPGLGAKEVLMASQPEKYVVDPHYHGFPAVLVRLEAMSVDELEKLLTEAWRGKAPKALVRQFNQPE